ncbi:hypothetical protein MPLSOD_510004 [Mesorhizobium sp. SOD10]|nr:hypothetical protein MPLSOD_510004 [Mesorhizobium sp. SOD10]
MQNAAIFWNTAPPFRAFLSHGVLIHQKTMHYDFLNYEARMAGLDCGGTIHDQAEGGTAGGARAAAV